MKSTIKDTLTAIAETEGTTVERLLTATLGEERICSRCGGSGIYSKFHGTCWKCGGSRPRWIHVPACRTRKLLGKVESRVASVRHTFRKDGWAMVKNLEEVRRWESRGGPITAAQWVKEEGERVHWRLWHIADEARVERERAEKQAAKVAKWNEGSIDVPAALLDGERHEITGEIVGEYERPGYTAWSAPTLCMVVKVTAPEGWYKVMGTMPAALRRDASKGDTVTFVATLKAGREANAAYLNRPSKAKKISVSA